MTCSCGLSKAHFACNGCGMHALLDSQPCPRCRYFKFAVVEPSPSEVATTSEALTETTAPAPAQKPKRRLRGVADTQRN